MRKGSRYEDARAFVGEDGAPAPFRGFRPRSIGRATGVVEHTVTRGERPDRLGRHYYNDDRRWWRIVDANPEFVCGVDLLLDHDVEDEEGATARASRVGHPVRVPRARE